MFDGVEDSSWWYKMLIKLKCSFTNCTFACFLKRVVANSWKQKHGCHWLGQDLFFDGNTWAHWISCVLNRHQSIQRNVIGTSYPPIRAYSLFCNLGIFTEYGWFSCFCLSIIWSTIELMSDYAEGWAGLPPHSAKRFSGKIFNATKKENSWSENVQQATALFMNHQKTKYGVAYLTMQGSVDIL